MGLEIKWGGGGGRRLLSERDDKTRSSSGSQEVIQRHDHYLQALQSACVTDWYKAV